MSCERDPAVRAALLDKRVAKTKGTCSFLLIGLGMYCAVWACWHHLN